MDAEARIRRVRGEVVAFGKLMAALTTMKRRDRVSEFDVAVYESRTAHIPLPILSRAMLRWLDTEKWFPTVHDILETCEAIRVEMRAALKFEPCADCRDNGGFVSLIDGRGVSRVTRCTCWKVHQDKVKALGVPAAPLALPAPSELSRIGEDAA